jgi:hypothetical protein
MLVLLALGLLVAIGHHCFYEHLNYEQLDQAVIKQVWAIRIGNAFAFLFKSVLVAALTVSFSQRFWFEARQRTMRIRLIDNIFGLLQNPFNFFEKDLLLKAKVLSLFAAIVWILPVAAIFAPGALTGQFHSILQYLIVVQSNIASIEVTNVDVPVTALDRDIGFFEVGTGYLDLGPSSALNRLVVRVLTNGEFIPWPSPCGSNCSYSSLFTGPAFDCHIVDERDVQQLKVTGLPTSSDTTFYNASVGSDENNQTAPVGFWISVYQTNGSNLIGCSLYNATYLTSVQYSENVQAVDTSLVLHNTVQNFVAEGYAFNITTESLGPYPITEWWSWVNQYSVATAVMNCLMGSLRFSINDGWIVDQTMITLSNMINLAAEQPIPDDIAQQIQTFLMNTTLSLLQISEGSIYEGAAGEQSDPPATNISAEATILTYPARYVYSAKVLWEVYASALGCCMFCVCIGVYALSQNDIEACMSFSQIVATTRNEALDQICTEAGLTGKNVLHELGNTKVKFGLLRDIGSVQIVANEINSTGS